MKIAGVIILALALWMTAVSTVGMTAEPCNFEGITFFGKTCRTLEGGTRTSSSDSEILKVSTYPSKTAPFGCKMAQMLEERRDRLIPAGFKWSPEVARQLATAYRFYFSRESNSAIGYSLVEIIPVKCPYRGGAEYYIWTRDSIVSGFLPGCKPVKIVVPLHLAGLCQRRLKVLMLPPNDNVIPERQALFMDFDLESETEQFFPAITPYRTRQDDLLE